MMKSDRNEKVVGLLLTLAGYALFVSLFVTAISAAFGTDPFHFLRIRG